jgi:hypothetical protein
MQLRLPALFIAVSAVAAMSACDNPTAEASLPNLEDSTLVVYAVNGSPQNAPTAIGVRFGAIASVSPGFNFDVAFDLTTSGNVQVYTPRALASQLVAVHRVGLKDTVAAFSTVLRVPGGGFTYDSSMVVPVGRTFLVDASDANCLGAIRGPQIRAKLRVDSVNTTTKAFYIHILSNPNCGFMSLAPGTPKD